MSRQVSFQLILSNSIKQLKNHDMAAENRDFTIAQNSDIQGTGLFAKKTIPRGTRIIAYQGLRVPKTQLLDDLSKGLTNMIYVMNLNETTVIDGEREGNDARFINHSCAPNCEVLFFDDTPFIYAMREISTTEELSFDYHLGFASSVDITSEQKKQWFPCNCGAKTCRGTLLEN
jgi:uncharacterized protein